MNRNKFESMSVVDLKNFYDSSVSKYSKFKKIVDSYKEANKSLNKFYIDRLRLEFDKFVESFRSLSVFSVNLSDVEREFIKNIINPVLSGLVSKTIRLKDNLYIYKRGLGVIRPGNSKVSFSDNPVSELSNLSGLADDFVFDGLSVYQSSVIKKLANFCFEFSKLEHYANSFHLVSKVNKDIYDIYFDKVYSRKNVNSFHFSSFVDSSSFHKQHFYDYELFSLACFVFDPSLFDRVVSFQKGLASRVKLFEDSVRVAFSKELLFKSI